MASGPYGREYRRARARLLAAGPECWVPGCRERASVADHQPPLVAHHHLGEGRGCCVLVPQCARHSAEQGSLVRDGIRPAAPWDPTDPVVEPAGYDADHVVWAVPWLDDLRDVPPDATWPRLMTPPHPRAVGSLGPDLIAGAEAMVRRPLRWWQQLVAVRLLEIDGDGRLVWDAALLSLARQLGKSWLLRELCWWRTHEGERFGEPQTILHTGKDLRVCKEVQRPARRYAKHSARKAYYRVGEANGEVEIERLEDGSRWMVQARTSVYGASCNLAAVDEAWKVDAEVVDDGVTPTMVEREQPQLLLISTAHRKATSLMLNRRRVALNTLDHPGDGDLILEWSAPRGAALDDRQAWRLASPHWTPQREKVIADALDRALHGEVDDVDEPDPIEAFRSQWLNQWPAHIARVGKGEPLLDDPDQWTTATTSEDGEGVAVVAVEDWFGKGAAVAVARATPAGGIIIAGWEYPRRADAFAAVAQIADRVDVRLVVGANLSTEPAVADIPALTVTPATGPMTRAGLSAIRDLVADGRLVWDPSDGDQLDEQLRAARVSPLSSGLSLLPGTRGDLLRAAAWAVTVCAAAAPVPAVL